MAATIGQQQQQLAELKEALKKIIQMLPHAMAPTVAAPTAIVPLRPASGSRVSLLEVYPSEPETLQGFLTIMSFYFVQNPALDQKMIPTLLSLLGEKAL